MVQIAGYLKTSFIEWSGKISAVVFIPGCNFRCPFCYNAELVAPAKIKRLKEYSEKSILTDLKARRKWVDGVVFTGGEPLLQSGLAEFLKKVKELGFETMIETNGSRPKPLDQLMGDKLIDFIAMDFKTTFASYAKVVNPKSEIRNPKMLLEGIRRSARLILKSGLPYEFRTTVVPTIHDQKKLFRMAKELKKIFENCKLKIENCRWVLQPFQPKNCLEPEFLKIKPFAQKQMKSFLGVVQKLVPETKIG